MEEFLPLTDSDARSVINTLVSAFSADPLMNWISPSAAFLRMSLEFAMPAYLCSGYSYSDADRCGVALWARPDALPKLAVTWKDVWRLYRVGGLRSLIRFYKVERLSERWHPAEPHYYLFMIGVNTAAKGKGTGKRLIRHVLDQCDDEGVGAYLENSNEKNLTFYESVGFKVTNVIELGAGAPRMWLMWREPQTKGEA